MGILGEYIQCSTQPDIMAVSVGGQSFSLSVKSVSYDIAFDISILQGMASGIDVSIPSGSGKDELTAEYQNVRVVQPSGWECESFGALSWNFCSKKVLRKGSSMTFSFEEIHCNNQPGTVEISVTLHAYIIIGGKYQAVVEVMKVPLTKKEVKQPEILEFSASVVRGTIGGMELGCDGFVTLESIKNLPLIPVTAKPYMCPGPEPEPAPPVEKKTVNVRWRTENAAYLELSVGGKLETKEGSKNISVNKSLNSMELTAYSEGKIFCVKKKVSI